MTKTSIALSNAAAVLERAAKAAKAGAHDARVAARWIAESPEYAGISLAGAQHAADIARQDIRRAITFLGTNNGENENV